MIKGIDVSHWQGYINWYSVASWDYKFAFIKATEGTAFKDAKFPVNWAGAKEAGLYRGAYHFWREAGDYGIQALNFKNYVGKDIGEIYPVLDLEDKYAPKGGTTPSKVKACLDKIEEYFERKPIIYTGAWWWNAWMKPVPSWTQDYDLWVAHYTTAYNPIIPAGWNIWKLWQYTSQGKVDGINGNVDINRFNGSEQDFRKYIEAEDLVTEEFTLSKSTDRIIINLT